MIPTTPLDQLDTEQLRSLAVQLLKRVEHLDTQLASLGKEVLPQKPRNQQLIHENKPFMFVFSRDGKCLCLRLLI
ncbi:hypothetical protein [Pseudomonas fluorescens]|uniref:hypothetical protein n=1 Tax=Pseudomonas fluorescens TaxID=294 RepID=UPI000FF2D22C|nr:hypothetical protein [Pseudomonas fluorescens]RON91296.1 hypothetical protein BK668_06670 [Pseudomonas fluorescens]